MKFGSNFNNNRSDRNVCFTGEHLMYHSWKGKVKHLKNGKQVCGGKHLGENVRLNYAFTTSFQDFPDTSLNFHHPFLSCPQKPCCFILDFYYICLSSSSHLNIAPPPKKKRYNNKRNRALTKSLLIRTLFCIAASVYRFMGFCKAALHKATCRLRNQPASQLDWKGGQTRLQMQALWS